MNPRLLRLLIVAALLVAAGTVAFVASHTTDPNATPSASATPSVSAGIGDRVTDGVFDFTVTQVTCGTTRIGTATLGKSPNGQYCFLYVNVKNIGSSPRRVPLAEQHLIDQAGKRYEVDADAPRYVVGSKRLLEDIGAGSLVSGILTYDVLATATATKIELHESASSPGVTVDLTATSANPNCITPGRRLAMPVWYPKDLPLPEGSYPVKFDFAPLPNYKQAVFVVNAPLQPFVQNVLAEWPKQGWVLGRGDSEPGEAEDTFTKQREQRFGAFRASSGLCDQTKTLTYIVLGSLKAQATPTPSTSKR